MTEKTAMQQAIEYFEKHSLMAVVSQLETYLEEERKQSIKIYNKGFEDGKICRYNITQINETYNQK